MVLILALALHKDYSTKERQAVPSTVLLWKAVHTWKRKKCRNPTCAPGTPAGKGAGAGRHCRAAPASSSWQDSDSFNNHQMFFHLLVRMTRWKRLEIAPALSSIPWPGAWSTGWLVQAGRGQLCPDAYVGRPSSSCGLGYASAVFVISYLLLKQSFVLCTLGIVAFAWIKHQ